MGATAPAAPARLDAALDAMVPLSADCCRRLECGVQPSVECAGRLPLVR